MEIFFPDNIKQRLPCETVKRFGHVGLEFRGMLRERISWKKSRFVLIYKAFRETGRISPKRRKLSLGTCIYDIINRHMYIFAAPNAFVSLNVRLPHSILVGFEKLPGLGKFSFFGRENESLLRGNIQSVLFPRQRLLCLWCVILKQT